MANKTKNRSEFRSPGSRAIETAAAQKASEFSKLSSGEKYILELGFKYGAEFMIDYNKESTVNS